MQCITDFCLQTHNAHTHTNINLRGTPFFSLILCSPQGRFVFSRTPSIHFVTPSTLPPPPPTHTHSRARNCTCIYMRELKIHYEHQLRRGTFISHPIHVRPPGQNVSTVSHISLKLVSNCLKRSQFSPKLVSDKMSKFKLVTIWDRLDIWDKIETAPIWEQFESNLRLSPIETVPKRSLSLFNVSTIWDIFLHCQIGLNNSQKGLSGGTVFLESLSLHSDFNISAFKFIVYSTIAF